MQPNLAQFERLIRFFQQVYVHALTLQDLIETDDERQYDDVKPKYDRIAEQQFALFYQALNNPEAFEKVAKEFLDMQSKSGLIH